MREPHDTVVLRQSTGTHHQHSAVEQGVAEMLQIKTFEGLHERGERAIEQAETRTNAFLKRLMTEDIITVQAQTLVKPKEMTDGRVQYYTQHIITVVYRE